MKNILSIIAIFLIFILGCSEKKNVKKPNIIFIMADDLGYNDLSCYGQELITTPNIDKIAENGIKFTQFYSATSLCAPSRAGLMTGKHMGHSSIRHNQKFGNDLKDGEKTIASVLKTAGYTTACIGKWGVGFDPAFNSPNKHGFDYHFGYINMWHAHNFYPEYLFRNGEKVPLKNKVTHLETHNYFPQYVGWAHDKHEYSHDLFAEEALAFIDKQTDPFFLYLPFTIPHENGEARILQPDDLMEIPDLGSYADKPWTIHEKGKAAMIERMDKDIGRIIKKLEENQKLDNTLIIFTSDNGGNNWELFESNKPLRGKKAQFYEGGIRIPFVAQWIGKIPPNTTSNHIGAFWDVMETFAEIADVKNVPKNDGISFLPALMGKENTTHKYLYWELPNHKNFEQAVRMGNWKGIRFIDNEKMYNHGYFPKLELYDLSNDISESEDVSEENPEIVQKIEQIMQDARTDHPNLILPTFQRE